MREKSRSPEPDAISSQVIDALEAQEIKKTGMTIGLNLGDRSSWYCVLDETGQVVLEQKVGTTPKAVREVIAMLMSS